MPKAVKKRKRIKQEEMIFTSPDGGKTVYGQPLNGKGPKILVEETKDPDWYLSELEISAVVDYANEGNKTLQIQLKKLKLLYNLIKEDRW